MVDTLRCDEVFHTPLLEGHNRLNNPVAQADQQADPSLSRGQGLASSLSDYQGLIPQFCSSVRDRAILQDQRVLRNMLMLEGHYVPNRQD